ncbi:MAG: hypothetical protein ACE5D3_04550 [Candidatus Binatia bacterium]
MKFAQMVFANVQSYLFSVEEQANEASKTGAGRREGSQNSRITQGNDELAFTRGESTPLEPTRDDL